MHLGIGGRPRSIHGQRTGSRRKGHLTTFKQFWNSKECRGGGIVDSGEPLQDVKPWENRRRKNQRMTQLKMFIHF